MISPFTASPLDALLAAQTSVGLTLTAALLFRPFGRKGMALFLASIWLAVSLPGLSPFLSGLGIKLPARHFPLLLVVSAALAAMATFTTRRIPLIAAALAALVAMTFLAWYIQRCDWELAALQLLMCGVLIGCHFYHDLPDLVPHSQDERHPTARVHDGAIFLLSLSLATLVCFVVLQRFTNSADEWGYTFQAAVFAKGQAWAPPPPCSEALRSFWVFEWGGKQFSQYTPGWPYFMVPFVILRIPEMAGPVAFALLAVGVARLARRAAVETEMGKRATRAAGWLAAVGVMFGTTYLINGASRYPHVFVATLYAWALESLLAVTSPGPSEKKWRSAVLLGLTAGLLPATRPPDGFALGIGLFLYALWAVLQRRVELRSALFTLLALGAVGGLTLWILREQLGAWFTTGYSLNSRVYPWSKVSGFSIPAPDQYRWAFPLATGSYCWFPCAPALGLAGLASLRGRARRIGVVLGLSYVPFLLFYTLNETGRGWDLGYGPRYVLPTVVPMAVGGGVLLAPLFAAGRWNASRARGAAWVATVSIALGVMRIAPMIYPWNYEDVEAHARLPATLRKAHLQHALVVGGAGLNNTDPMDLTENLPPVLYPDERVIIAIDRSPELNACLRKAYGDRVFYRAVSAGRAVELVPDP